MEGLFGGLLDFNGDGRTDFAEEALELSMLAALCEEKEEEEDSSLKISIEIALGDGNSDAADEEAETRLELLRDALSSLELEEPEDVFSDEYDDWEEEKLELEEQIEELEERLGE